MLNKLTESGFRPLIAVHRGKSGAAVVENTVYSALNAFNAGADIVEFDVQRTLDNKIAVFHEGMEFKLLFPCLPPVMFSLMGELKKRRYRSESEGLLNYGICDLEEYLSALKGKGILNFDRIWCADIKKCLEIVKRLEMFDQILFKSKVCEGKNKVLDHLKNYPEAWFMPICKSYRSYLTAKGECAKRGIVIRGTEVIFKSGSDEFMDPEFIAEEKKEGRFVWANSIHLNGKPDMCFNHGDNFALFGDPDEHWGVLADLGYGVIQTDWPEAMLKYFDSERYKAKVLKKKTYKTSADLTNAAARE